MEANQNNPADTAVQAVQPAPSTVSNNNVVEAEQPGLHLLQTEWTLWLYTNNKAKSWDENLQKVISFNVVVVLGVIIFSLVFC